MEPLLNHDIAIVAGGVGGGMCLIIFIILFLVIVLARIWKRYKDVYCYPFYLTFAKFVFSKASESIFSSYTCTLKKQTRGA